MKNIARRLAQIFLGSENIEEMKKRGLALSLAVPAFRWFDWILVGLTQTLVGFLKHWEFSNVSIFLMLWAGNVALNFSIVTISDKTKIDFTLMEGLRRLIDATIEKSKIMGRLLEGLVLIRLTIWDGSDNVVIFFRHKLENFYLRLLVFVVVSGLQMAVWTTLYVLGYKSFNELFERII